MSGEVAKKAENNSENPASSVPFRSAKPVIPPERKRPDETNSFPHAGDLALAQQFARHASVATTVDVYGHLETEDLVRGMRRAGQRWAVAVKE